MEDGLTKLPETPPAMPEDINLFTGGNFDRLLKVAEFFAKSDLIPSHFQGKPANVFIALEVAHRHNMSIFAVMQSLFVVHGRPGFEGKFLIALANQAGWNLQYEIERDKADNITACTAFSDRYGVRTYGPKISAAMVKAEGWDRPKGSMTSKWVTLPELMYRYRAGSYFVNTVCPQLKMGMPTVEEIEDMTIDITPSAPPEPALVHHETTPIADDPDFDTLATAWEHSDSGRLPEYLEAVATYKKCDIVTVKIEAAKNWDKFTGAFSKWVKKNAPKTPPDGGESPRIDDLPPVNGLVSPDAAITEAQIVEIEKLCAEKDIPVAACLIDPVEDILDLRYGQAVEVIAKLRGL